MNTDSHDGIEGNNRANILLKRFSLNSYINNDANIIIKTAKKTILEFAMEHW